MEIKFNAENSECLRQLHRLDRESFESVSAFGWPVRCYEEHHFMCTNIPPGEKLSITVRFFATVLRPYSERLTLINCS